MVYGDLLVGENVIGTLISGISCFCSGIGRFHYG